MLLNMLIAMMNTSFELVLYVAEKEWLMIRASLILRIQRALGKKESLELMRKYLADMNREMVVIQNFTPGARLYKTNRYCVWEPAKAAEGDAKVDLQLLRNDLMELMQEHHEETKAQLQQLAQKK